MLYYIKKYQKKIVDRMRFSQFIDGFSQEIV